MPRADCINELQKKKKYIHQDISGLRSTEINADRISNRRVTETHHTTFYPNTNYRTWAYSSIRGISIVASTIQYLQIIINISPNTIYRTWGHSSIIGISTVTSTIQNLKILINISPHIIHKTWKDSSILGISIVTSTIQYLEIIINSKSNYNREDMSVF